MTEYIDREALKSEVVKRLGISEQKYLLPAEKAIWDVICAIPAANVAPVVRGKWIESDLDKDCVTCSNCKRLKLNNRYAFTKLAFEDWGLKFCPNCGSYNGGENENVHE